MSQKSNRRTDLKLTEKVLLQAVVIIDDFEHQFEPLTWKRSKGMVPLLNRPLVDHTLHFLQVRGIQQVFLFCSKHHEVVSRYIKEQWSSSKMEVNVSVSETHNSVGDVLRDVEREARVKSDFVLIRGDVVSNVNLIALLEEHRSRRSRDKGSLATCVFRQNSVVGPSDPEDVCIFVNSDDKVLHYIRGLNKSRVKVPLQMFKENSCVRVLNQLKDPHILICSNDVLTLFADNSDYQTSDDLIRGTLDNEDIMGNSIYVHLVDDYAARVDSAASYDEVSHDLICRWNHPFVPDKMDNFSFRKNNLFLDSSEQLNLSDSIISKNVMVGKGTFIGSGVSISDSVIGRNCHIGDRVVLHHAYIWDNVNIENDCKISQCIVADGVTLKANTVLKNGCVVCDDVTIGPDVVLENSCIRLPLPGEKISGVTGKSGNGLLHQFESKGLRWKLQDLVESEAESEAGSASDSDNDVNGDDESDYVKLFYAEVLDNFKRGLSENVSPDNLILEINSMKHAYNIRINEVNTLVLQAVLEVPELLIVEKREYGAKLFEAMQKCLPVLKNYIRDDSSQLDCLLALEEFHLNRSDLFTINHVVKVVQTLYDKEVLEEDNILEWYEKGNELPGLLHPAVDEKRQHIMRQDQLLVTFIKWLQEADEESE